MPDSLVGTQNDDPSFVAVYVTMEGRSVFPNCAENVLMQRYDVCAYMDLRALPDLDEILGVPGS